MCMCGEDVPVPKSQPYTPPNVYLPRNVRAKWREGEGRQFPWITTHDKTMVLPLISANSSTCSLAAGLMLTCWPCR